MQWWCGALPGSPTHCQGPYEGTGPPGTSEGLRDTEGGGAPKGLTRGLSRAWDLRGGRGEYFCGGGGGQAGGRNAAVPLLVQQPLDVGVQDHRVRLGAQAADHFAVGIDQELLVVPGDLPEHLRPGLAPEHALLQVRVHLREEGERGGGGGGGLF